jgi:hypothetical protein
MKNRIGVLGGAAVLALVAVCFFLWRQNQNLHQRIVVLRTGTEAKDQRNEADRQRLKQLERQATELNRRVQTLTGELQNRRAAPAPAAGPAALAPAAASADAAGEGGKTKGGFAEMLSRMMDNPEMKKMMRQQQGLVMDMMYGGLFKELQLTPEETDQFKELLLDHQMKAMEAGGAFLKLQGQETDQTAAMNELAGAQKESDAQIKAFLGDDRYGQFKEYQETMAERMTLSQFSQQMAGGQNPLSADQSQQLLEIMKQEKKGTAPALGESGADGSLGAANWQAMMSEGKMNDFLKQQEDLNQRVLERAKAVLTPEQLEAFATHQASQLQMQRMGVTMAVKMFGGEKSDSPPPSTGKP